MLSERLGIETSARQGVRWQPLLDARLPLAIGWLAAVVVIVGLGPFHGLLLGLGFVAGFASGLVGIGGGVIVLPLLLFAPSAVGFHAIDVHTVTGIAAVQVTAASLSAFGGHLSKGGFDRGLFVPISITMMAASALGSVVSGSLDPNILKLVFAIMAILAAGVLLGIKPRGIGRQPPMTVGRRAVASISGLAIGFPAGIVGVGGAFLVTPVLVHLLKVDVRTALGTSLGVVALSSAASLAGKAGTGQVDWLLATSLVAGAVPAGRLGSAVSHRVPVRTLSVILGTVVALVGVWLLVDVLA